MYQESSGMIAAVELLSESDDPMLTSNISPSSATSYIWACFFRGLSQIFPLHFFQKSFL